MPNVISLIKEFKRKHLNSNKSTSLKTDIQRPNTAEEWEREYLINTKPIQEISHPIALLLKDLTNEGDILLETGCGSGEISAQLSLGKRIIELADFSEKILLRSKTLFHLSGLPEPKTTCCDITKHPLPWAENAVDVTWSSGVLEHWTDEELIPIVSEMARISRKKVISLVPYAGSLFYRLGKDYAERKGTWAYGRELPRYSLQLTFEQAGLTNIFEKKIWPEQAIKFLKMINHSLYNSAVTWWDSLDKNDPLKKEQGYLLLTVGETNYT